MVKLINSLIIFYCCLFLIQGMHKNILHCNILYEMYVIDVQRNLVIAYNDAINCNQVFNKVKPNPKKMDYKNSFNNGVNYLI